VCLFVSGPVISHWFKSSGVKLVHVHAKNKVKDLYLSAEVYVDYEIQGKSSLICTG